MLIIKYKTLAAATHFHLWVTIAWYLHTSLNTNWNLVKWNKIIFANNILNALSSFSQIICYQMAVIIIIIIIIMIIIIVMIIAIIIIIIIIIII